VTRLAVLDVNVLVALFDPNHVHHEVAQRLAAFRASCQRRGVLRGSLKVNDNAPAVGRHAITETAQGFMTAFPDMQVLMDGVAIKGDGVLYRWTLVGTNTGPGGTGRSVRIGGYEEWRIGADGLIEESLGQFDSEDYQRQLDGRQ
jgi:hypothetical protein